MRLSHLAIHSIANIIEDKEYLFILYDFVEEVTLDEVLKHDGAQHVEKVIEWTKKLCDALDYLHTREPTIIFCDINPSNVMLKSDG